MPQAEIGWPSCPDRDQRVRQEAWTSQYVALAFRQCRPNDARETVWQTRRARAIAVYTSKDSQAPSHFPDLRWCPTEKRSIWALDSAHSRPDSRFDWNSSRRSCSRKSRIVWIAQWGKESQRMWLDWARATWERNSPASSITDE